MREADAPPAGTAAPVEPGGVVYALSARSLRVPIQAVLVACVVAAGLEAAARTTWICERLATPSFGAPLRRLDLVLAGLAKFSESGPIDCVVVGSSVVMSAVDPRVVSAEYARRIGRPFRCFNLGVPGASAATSAALGRIVVEDYRPRLLVYGTSARDYRPTGGYDTDPTLGMAWVRYRLGNWSLDGWLIDHSAAYRQLLAYRRRLVAGARASLEVQDAVVAVDGFLSTNRVMTPRAYRSDEQLGPIFGVAEAAVPPEPDLTPLADLARLRDRGTSVAIVEVPFDPLMMTSFRFAERDYPTFVARITEFSGAHALSLWRPSATILPSGSWAELGHMNAGGARVFSTFLGDAIADSGLPGPSGAVGE